MMTRALVCAALCCLTACQKNETPPAPASSQAASASAVASAAPPEPEKPWYAGSWAGSYTAERFGIELPIGAVPAWKKDDGSKASGPGKIALEVSPEGVVSGSAEGPLGKHRALGTADAETIRVEFVPETPEPQAFRGVMLASRDGEKAKGELRASSGDSLTVRRADVTLDRSSK